MAVDNGAGLDYFKILSESRRLAEDPGIPAVRIALVGDAATQQFVPVLRVLLRRAGFDARIYEAPFAGAELAAINPASDLYSFAPDFIVFLNCVQALRTEFYERRPDTPDFSEGVLQRMRRIWDAVRSHSQATIIQSNFVLPYERFFGNFDLKAPESWYSTVSSINSKLAEAARACHNVFVNDVEAIASWHGRKTWFDDRLWFLAKSFCALEYIPSVCRNICEIISAQRGRVVKCVVLDLDNTLWGGIIGDDGVNGICLASHGDGECFHNFQSFLLELSKRGILLAVCSKNDLKNALEPFLSHPDMVLRREHIVEFVANWEDKASNIRQIRERLNIGIDSMVFLDDNPFERDLVRQLLPGITVPDLPEDPSGYVQALSELNLFETATFSAEDLKRAEMYRAESERREEQAGYANLEEFLESLDMRITVARFDDFHLPRIAQLIQRSNQFNLTTRRLSQTQCAALASDNERFLPIYAKLADRLGDHGLISVVICEIEDDALAIRDWLMSCRVLKRGVEQFLMTFIFDFARTRGLRRVTGEYIPTAKNEMVRDFFAQFGFTRTSVDDAGRSQWEHAVEDFQPARVFIAAVPEPASMQ